MPLAAYHCDEPQRAVSRPMVCPPPGLSLPESGASAAHFPATQTRGGAHPRGLHGPLNLSAAWQGRGLACESDCCSTDASTSEPASPATSGSAGEATVAAAGASGSAGEASTSEPPSPATFGSAAGEATAAAAGGYVAGRILRASMAQRPHDATVTLRLEDRMWPSLLRTPNCPSVGSVGHQLGLCRPCDFFHRSRCVRDADCKYCHLCGPEESRQRKRQNRNLKKVTKHLQGAGVMAAYGMAWDEGFFILQWMGGAGVDRGAAQTNIASAKQAEFIAVTLFGARSNYLEDIVAGAFWLGMRDLQIHLDGMHPHVWNSGVAKL
eukprot:CAMPEP_0115474046 /NCGR_PEP_ID=MMETSP0271-20121206/53890_1 /TAXON_ID=71861 /ORGANISM="Scrippsiella trochoidea, Strain CCMP3099" /LENGTH=322 /DNA_ID=CAMNT_0002901357 /DNA_START=7 /DNA_END=973 /DNA_ORIENTATION=+